MSQKITTGYSELQILLKEIGVNFKDSGPAEDNLGKFVSISIGHDNLSEGVKLNFRIDNEGNETFVGQD